jgi:hypothetical protein
MTANIGPERIAGNHDTALAGPPVDPRIVDEPALPVASAAT